MSENLNAIRPGYHHIGNFGGKDRYVRYDLNAFAEMERLYGSMEAANNALTRGSMTDVRRILWLGLIHDQAVLDEVTGEPIKYNLTVYEAERSYFQFCSRRGSENSWPDRRTCAGSCPGRS